MLVFIDNYDSFTFNLVDYFGQIYSKEIVVARNDKKTVAEIEALNPEHIVISPGPKDPEQAGISLDVIRHFQGKVPILGVCLGHQAIGAIYGGQVVEANHMMHGKTSEIKHNGAAIFDGISNPFVANRYHSLVIDQSYVGDQLEIIAYASDDQEIMAVQHKTHPTVGLQFHPESILTPEGKKMLSNFLEHYHVR